MIENSNRGLSRLSSLLKMFRLEARAISSSRTVEEIIKSPIDYKKVNFIKKEEQIKAYKFLYNTIK